MSTYSTCDKCYKLTEGSGSPSKFCKCPTKLSPKAQELLERALALPAHDKNWLIQKLLGGG